MVMLHWPPTRRSTSQSELVNTCGPHQAVRCLGSVQTFHISVTGASTSRLRVTDACPWTWASTGASAVIGRILLNLLQIAFEAVQALVPEPLVLFEPFHG